MSDFMKSVRAAGSAVASAASKILPEKNRAPAAPAADSKKTAAPSDDIATVALLAWRASQKNPRLLTAYLPGNDPTNPNHLVTVNVANNKNFLPHMKLRARRVQGAIYDLVGPLPRWRGRW